MTSSIIVGIVAVVVTLLIAIPVTWKVAVANKTKKMLRRSVRRKKKQEA